MESTIIIIILLIVVSLCACKKKYDVNYTKYNNGKNANGHKQDQYLEVNCDIALKGMNELENSTQSRGRVPYANQPNHIANRWKCDYTHPMAKSNKDGVVNIDFTEDTYSPLRSAVTNMNVQDCSDQHLSTRFGSTTTH
jgi:hypothetical protein